MTDCSRLYRSHLGTPGVFRSKAMNSSDAGRIIVFVQIHNDIFNALYQWPLISRWQLEHLLMPLSVFFLIFHRVLRLQTFVPEFESKDTQWNGNTCISRRKHGDEQVLKKSAAACHEYEETQARDAVPIKTC